MLLGQFSPTGAVTHCVSNVVALRGSRRLKNCIAQNVQTTVVVQAGLCRGNVSARSTQSLSPCRSRTSQVDGCLSRLLPVLPASTPEFHGCSSGRAERACKRSLCGYGDLSRMGMRWKNTRGLSVFLLGPCYQKAWLMGMRRWKRGVHIGGAASGVSSPQASEVGVPCRQGTQCWLIRNLDTSLVVFLRGICSGLGPSPGKRCTLARHLLIARTVQVWPPVSQNSVSIAQVSKMQTIPGIYFSGADFFPSAVFPTISQTFAAEA